MSGSSLINEYPSLPSHSYSQSASWPASNLWLPWLECAVSIFIQLALALAESIDNRIFSNSKENEPSKKKIKKKIKDFVFVWEWGKDV